MTAVRAVSITLPLPPKECHQNRSGRTTSWQAEAQAKREARLFAKMQARGITDTPFRECSLEMIFRFPDKRRRDLWNYAGACKSYLDGLVDAGVLVDDSKIIEGRVRGGLDKESPGVTFVITEVGV